MPIHIKNDKQCVKSYRSVSLLPMVTYLIESNLIFENQSGFKTGYFCANHLLAINHKIHFLALMTIAKLQGYYFRFGKLSIKCGTRELFIRIGISGNLLSLLPDFLRNRKKRVILNDLNSSWADINAGFPQGSIHVFFLIRNLFIRNLELGILK